MCFDYDDYDFVVVVVVVVVLFFFSRLYSAKKRGAFFFGVFFRVDARWASRRADRPFFLNELFLLIIFVSRMM